MEFNPVKTIMNKTKKSDYWYAVDYNVNIYRGCSHGCVYCDSRSKSYQIENFSTVTGKENSLQILEQEMKRKRKQKYIIGTGAMSDPYNPQEKEYELTRGLIKLCIKYGAGLCITTKSDLILRDLDLLIELNEIQPVLVNVTITTLNEDISRRIEKHVSTPQQRLDVLKKLRDSHIMTSAIVMPILPFINDNPILVRKLFDAIKETGTRNIYAYFGVTLRDRQRTYFYKQIKKEFGQGLVDLYKRTYKYMYNCQSPSDRQLKEMMYQYGVEENMCTTMTGINKQLHLQFNKIKVDEQITLF